MTLEIQRWKNPMRPRSCDWTIKLRRYARNETARRDRIALLQENLVIAQRLGIESGDFEDLKPASTSQRRS